MKQAIKLILLTSLLCSQIVLAQTWALLADTWSSPRTAFSVSQMPSVKKMMNSWQKLQHRNIEIIYPGGEAGELWASELKDWLIALGVAKNKIKLNTGSAVVNQLQMNIVGKL